MTKCRACAYHNTGVVYKINYKGLGVLTFYLCAWCGEGASSYPLGTSIARSDLFYIGEQFWRDQNEAKLKKKRYYRAIDKAFRAGN